MPSLQDGTAGGTWEKPLHRPGPGESLHTRRLGSLLPWKQDRHALPSLTKSCPQNCPAVRALPEPSGQCQGLGTWCLLQVGLVLTPLVGSDTGLWRQVSALRSPPLSATRSWSRAGTQSAHRSQETQRGGCRRSWLSGQPGTLGVAGQGCTTWPASWPWSAHPEGQGLCQDLPHQGEGEALLL